MRSIVATESESLAYFCFNRRYIIGYYKLQNHLRNAIATPNPNPHLTIRYHPSPSYPPSTFHSSTSSTSRSSTSYSSSFYFFNTLLSFNISLFERKQIDSRNLIPFDSFRLLTLTPFVCLFYFQLLLTMTLTLQELPQVLHQPLPEQPVVFSTRCPVCRALYYPSLHFRPISGPVEGLRGVGHCYSVAEKRIRRFVQLPSPFILIALQKSASVLDHRHFVRDSLQLTVPFAARRSRLRLPLEDFPILLPDPLEHLLPCNPHLTAPQL